MYIMTRQKIINIAVFIIAVVAIALGGYFYYQLKILKTNPATIAKEEASDLVSKISKHYLLPVGEDPTVATVSDPEVLKSQSFFTNSLKGDKVLIYAKAGKAILYRPSIDKIIETAPINNNKPAMSSATSVETSDSFKVGTPIKDTTPTKTTTKR